MTAAARHAAWRAGRARVATCDPLGTGLTERQREILRLSMHGYTNPQIARGTGINLATLKRDYHAAATIVAGNEFAEVCRTRLAVWLFAREFPRAIGASAILVPAPPPISPADRLTDRDREMLRLLAEGQGNADVARHFGVTVHTVKNRLTIVFAAIGIDGRAAPRAAAAAWWVRHAGDIAHAP